MDAPASPASSAAFATCSFDLGKSGWSGTGEEPVTAQVMMVFFRMGQPRCRVRPPSIGAACATATLTTRHAAECANRALNPCLWRAPWREARAFYNDRQKQV